MTEQPFGRTPLLEAVELALPGRGKVEVYAPTPNVAGMIVRAREMQPHLETLPEVLSCVIEVSVTKLGMYRASAHVAYANATGLAAESISRAIKNLAHKLREEKLTADEKPLSEIVTEEAKPKVKGRATPKVTNPLIRFREPARLLLADWITRALEIPQ